MKKLTSLLYLSAILFMINGCGQNQQSEGYHISGSIKGLDTGKIILVKSNPADRTSVVFDSTEMKDGSFTLEGKVESPAMMTLSIKPGNWSLNLFVENSKINIEADTTGSRHYDWTAYEGGTKGAEMQHYTVSGSENQDAWMKYQDDPGLNKYDPVFDNLNKQYQAANGNKAAQSEIEEELDSLRSVLFAARKNWIDSFVHARPASPAGAYMVQQYYMYHEDLPLEEMKSLMATFTGPAKSNLYYDILTEALAKREALQPGNTAPDFTALKRDSSEFTLSSLRGNYVMLDFWASWCVPCRKSIPHWKEVYAKYHPEGFEMVSITNDSRWSDWFKALEEEQMPWIQVADDFPIKNFPARIAELYMIPYLPTYVLLDKEGKIILHNASEQEIDEKLEEIYGG